MCSHLKYGSSDSPSLKKMEKLVVPNKEERETIKGVIKGVSFLQQMEKENKE